MAIPVAWRTTALSFFALIAFCHAAIAAASDPDKSFMDQRLIARAGVDDLRGVTVGEFVTHFSNMRQANGTKPTMKGWKDEKHSYVLHAETLDGPIRLVFRRGDPVLLSVFDNTGELFALSYALTVLTTPTVVVSNSSGAPIAGAFGYVLGDALAPERSAAHAELTPFGQEMMAKRKHLSGQRVTPPVDKQSEPFVAYTVWTTPVSHRIALILAESAPTAGEQGNHICHGDLSKAIANQLAHKYGYTGKVPNLRDKGFKLVQGARVVLLGCWHARDQLFVAYWDEMLEALGKSEMLQAKQAELERKEAEESRRLKELEKVTDIDNM